MQWNDELIDGLKKLWNDGLSASEIGRALGISKNAVVGKAHRLGLESRPSPIKRTAPPVPVKAKVIAFSGRSCCWPIGDPRMPDFHFCTANAVPGKPYCSEHAAQAYISPKSSKKEDAA